MLFFHDVRRVFLEALLGRYSRRARKLKGTADSLRALNPDPSTH